MSCESPYLVCYLCPAHSKRTAINNIDDSNYRRLVNFKSLFASKCFNVFRAQFSRKSFYSHQTNMVLLNEWYCMYTTNSNLKKKSIDREPILFVVQKQNKTKRNSSLLFSALTFWREFQVNSSSSQTLETAVSYCFLSTNHYSPHTLLKLVKIPLQFENKSKYFGPILHIFSEIPYEYAKL